MELDDVRNRLSRLLNSEGISGNRLSLEIDKSIPYVNRFIAGKSDITMSSFLDICKALDIEPKDYFDFEILRPGKAGQIYESVKQLNSGKNLELLDAWVKNLLELEKQAYSNNDAES